MSQKKPAIPDVPPQYPGLYELLSALKTNTELLTGVKGGTIATLKSSAPLADVVSKVNEIVNRLNVT